MQDISDRIKQIAKEAEPELISIRRELHQYPESIFRKRMRSSAES